PRRARRTAGRPRRRAAAHAARFAHRRPRRPHPPPRRRGRPRRRRRRDGEPRRRRPRPHRARPRRRGPGRPRGGRRPRRRRDAGHLRPRHPAEPAPARAGVARRRRRRRRPRRRGRRRGGRGERRELGGRRGGRHRLGRLRPPGVLDRRRGCHPARAHRRRRRRPRTRPGAAQRGHGAPRARPARRRAGAHPRGGAARRGGARRRPRCAGRRGRLGAPRADARARGRDAGLTAPARHPGRSPARPRRPRGARGRAPRRLRGTRRARPGTGTGRRVPGGGAVSGLLRLARRQATAHRAVPVALVLLVLLVAGVVTAWPRLLAGVDDRQTTHEIAGASPLARDVVAVLPGSWPHLPAPAPGSTPFEPDVEENLGGVLVALEELRAGQPEPLRSMLGAPQYWVETPPFDIAAPAEPLIGSQSLTLKLDPQLADHVELVEGRWPEPHTTVDPFAGLTDEERFTLTLDEETALIGAALAASDPLEVTVSASAAATLEWEVGTERRVIGNTVPVLLTGTYEPRDPGADVWAHNPNSAEAYVVDDLNLGTMGQA